MLVLRQSPSSPTPTAHRTARTPFRPLTLTSHLGPCAWRNYETKRFNNMRASVNLIQTQHCVYHYIRMLLYSSFSCQIPIEIQSYAFAENGTIYLAESSFGLLNIQTVNWVQSPLLGALSRRKEKKRDSYRIYLSANSSRSFLLQCDLYFNAQTMFVVFTTKHHSQINSIVYQERA